MTPLLTLQLMCLVGQVVLLFLTIHYAKRAGRAAASARASALRALAAVDRVEAARRRRLAADKERGVA